MEKMVLIFKNKNGELKRMIQKFDSIEALLIDKRVVYPFSLREKDISLDKIKELIKD